VGEVLEITAGNPNMVAKDHGYFLGCGTDQKKFRHGVHTDKWNVKVADADTNVTLNEWTHIAVTYDNKLKMIFYRNGKATDSFDIANPLNVAEASNVIIGAFQTVESKLFSQKFKGDIDEVAIIKRPLDAGEISQIMKGIATTSAVNSSGKLATNWSKIKANFGIVHN